MERLQKVLASAGLASRRECEELIKQGRITVDGKVVNLGFKVDVDKQVIKYDGEVLKPEKKVFYLFHKPKGCVCSNAVQGDVPRVIDYFKNENHRLFTVGRLDKDTEGLIIVTNDGDFAQTMTHPKYEVDRLYKVFVKGKINFNRLRILKEGVWLSEGKIKPKFIKVISSNKTSSTLKICIDEGKNREIRRIFAKIGHPVSNLIRIKFGPFELGDLKKEKYLKMSYSEIKKTIEDIKKNKGSAKSNIKKKQSNNVRSKQKLNNKKFNSSDKSSYKSKKKY